MDLFDELDAVWLVGSCAMKNSTTTFISKNTDTVSYDNNTQNNLNSKKDNSSCNYKFNFKIRAAMFI